MSYSEPTERIKLRGYRSARLPVVTVADINVGFCDEVESCARDAGMLPWRPCPDPRLRLKIHRGDLFDIDPFANTTLMTPQSQTALVSPANSFGFMDGGIDQIYTEVLGEEAVDRVRKRIIDEFEGELLVGQAIVVETGLETTYPYIIAAPTMRVPTLLPDDSVAPYLATRAAIRAAREYNNTHGIPTGARSNASWAPITNVLLPGMGTGVGLFPEEIAARQMVSALAEFKSGPTLPDTWEEASEAHQRLYTANVTDLQFERGKDNRRTFSGDIDTGG